MYLLPIFEQCVRFYKGQAHNLQVSGGNGVSCHDTKESEYVDHCETFPKDYGDSKVKESTG